MPALDRQRSVGRTAVLESGPPNIVLDFNEAVDAELANIELYDQDAS